MRSLPTSQELCIYQQSVAALAELSAGLRGRAQIRFADWLPLVPDAGRELGKLLRKYGSDKSTDHDYHEVYGSILNTRRAMQLKILEIGLGTNDLAVLSNMGAGGKPGASIRAFREWAPLATIYGADVDRKILFQEERIYTNWVDQTNKASLQELCTALAGTKFDLIIDDGLHLPHSNFNTLLALLPLLSETGTFVVEDIDPIHRPFWETAEALFSNKFDAYLAERKGGLMFLVRPSCHRR